MTVRYSAHASEMDDKVPPHLARNIISGGAGYKAEVQGRTGLSPSSPSTLF